MLPLYRFKPLRNAFQTRRNLAIDVDFFGEGYKLHLLDEGPSKTSELTKEDAKRFYTEMDKVRKFENTCADLYRAKLIRGFCHLYNGQEACAVGIHSIMGPEDTVITSYRCHPWALMSASGPTEVFAELLGRQSGISRGKAGSMHLYGKGFFGGNGIVGAHVPVGTGLALAHKYSKKKAVSVTLFGDGASNQGQVYEAFNIASLMKLPVLYVCENNHYGMGTSATRSSANTDYYRCSTYVPGLRANGMDVMAVREATKFAFKHIHDGKGPIVMELMTYRYFGHSMSDPGTSYRDRDEIKLVREKMDPIQHFRKQILSSNLMTEEELKKIESENKKMMQDALKKAQSDKPLPDSGALEDVYKQFKGKVKVPKPMTYVEHKNHAK